MYRNTDHCGVEGTSGHSENLICPFLPTEFLQTRSSRMSIHPRDAAAEAKHIAFLVAAGCHDL